MGPGAFILPHFRLENNLLGDSVGARRSFDRSSLASLALALENDFQDFIHVFDEFKLDVFFNFSRNFFQILFVVFRQNHGFNACSVGSDHFFLDATDFQDSAPKSDFTSHPHVFSHWNPGESRY